MRPYLTLHQPALARRYYASGHWAQQTLYGLLCSHAADRGQSHAIRDGRQRLTWAALKVMVDRCAQRIAALGITAGERVSIWSDNRLESVALLLACSRNGVACNPSLHRTHTAGEIVRLLDELGSRLLLTSPGWGADGRPGQIAEALAHAQSLRALWTPEMISATVGDDAAQAPCADLSPPLDDPDKVVYLAFTSGTTGAPKCVMHSDNTLLANARDLVRDWRHGPDTRIATLSPLSHHIAWVAVAQWLVAGCELITDDPPAGMGRLDWLIETGASYVMGVPTHAMDILAEQKRRGLSRLGSVRMFYMAGAAIPPTVAAAFVEQGVTPQNVYGMTENSSHQYTHPDDATETIVQTCGRGGPAYEVRLFDPADDDREVPAGVVGQIGGRGAALMLGYFGNQAATEKSFNRDGWFLSGDLGVMDAQGNLKIEGRLKDLIIRGGHNIYPASIEALALRHAAIEKCAVFPVADERLGERVCLAVIGSIDAAAALAHLAREGLSRYDMPEYFLRVDAFPLTASGKILKRELVEMVRQGALVPMPVRYDPEKENHR
ncbi:MAG: class I adenylate-forming enzyme family protein [Burkholderiaceae bacterium]